MPGHPLSIATTHCQSAIMAQFCLASWSQLPSLISSIAELVMSTHKQLYFLTGGEGGRERERERQRERDRERERERETERERERERVG